MSSIKSCDEGVKIDGTEEVGSTFVVACGNSAESSESNEQVLDQVPCPVQVFIVLAFEGSVGFLGNDDALARLLQRLDHSFVGVKRLVRDDHVRVNAGQQGIGSVKVMRLSWREMKICGVAQCISCRMDFRSQPAFAPPDRFLYTMPPFAPALCW